MREEAPVLPPAPRAIGDDEAARLFAPFADLMASGLVLAVSGGSDSMALMHLAARWADGVAHGGRLRPRITVVTIDHALRADSRADAAFVCEAANALGLPVTCLRWDGPKPRTGLSEAAREARYALLTEAMRDVGARLLMTAHTADDQAETLLMRLARGSGIDGLAGMAPLRPLARLDGAHLARPLLGLEKARLRAHLAACGIVWREDPTNVDPDYERPRLRAARDALAALGLTTAPLALSARRLRRAADALDATAREAFTGPGVRVDPCGLVQIDRPTLLSFPTEIGLRVLRRAIEIAGGAAAPIPLASLEYVLADLNTGRTAGRTLARAALHVKGDVVSVEREPGRAPLPRMTLTEGARVLWDGRFEIEVDRCAPGMEAGPLGADGLATLKAQGGTRPKLPVRTLRALPAIWRGADLVAVPLLGASHEPALQLDVRTILRGGGRKAAQAQAAS